MQAAALVGIWGHDLAPGGSFGLRLLPRDGLIWQLAVTNISLGSEPFSPEQDS